MDALLTFFADNATPSSVDETVHKSTSVLSHIVHSVFNLESAITLIIALAVAVILGRVAAYGVRRVTTSIGNQIDSTQNLAVVTKLRRVETLLILSIAIVRILLVIFALYYWWLFVHPGLRPSALIGAGAVIALIVSAALTPVLRDMASGAVMMAEHWFGVGDHIRVDPYVNAQGVVERVTLRSTRIRDVSGEVVWINNQNIWAVHVTPRGVRTIAIELFVTDLEKCVQLLDDTNNRLPTGSLMIIAPITIMTQAQTGGGIWHVTAISETAPGREWLLDKTAVHIIDELNEKAKILVNDPITRYTDGVSERKFAQAIQNSRKLRTERHTAARKLAKERADKLTTRHSKAKKPNGSSSEKQ
jgi:hypothetical protein